MNYCSKCGKPIGLKCETCEVEKAMTHEPSAKDAAELLMLCNEAAIDRGELTIAGAKKIARALKPLLSAHPAPDAEKIAEIRKRHVKDDSAVSNGESGAIMDPFWQRHKDRAILLAALDARETVRVPTDTRPPSGRMTLAKDERDRAAEVADEILDGLQNTIRNALLDFAEADWNDGFGKGLERGMKSAPPTAQDTGAGR